MTETFHFHHSFVWKLTGTAGAAAEGVRGAAGLGEVMVDEPNCRGQSVASRARAWRWLEQGEEVEYSDKNDAADAAPSAPSASSLIGSIWSSLTYFLRLCF